MERFLKLFRRVKHMIEERLTGRVCEFEVERRRDRGRPCTRWLDGVETGVMYT